MYSSMFCLYVYFCTADYVGCFSIDFQIPAEVQKECVFFVCIYSSIYVSSNGNASETKANESFDNGVFFNIEANTFDSLKIYFEAKRTCLN